MSFSRKTRFALVEPHSPQSLVVRCEEGGIRMGSRRRVVVLSIAQAKGSFDGDVLLSEGRRVEPKLSRATIHRLLLLLQRLDLVRKIAGRGQNTQSGNTLHADVRL